jgi:hypothetical protein
MIEKLDDLQDAYKRGVLGHKPRKNDGISTKRDSGFTRPFEKWNRKMLKARKTNVFYRVGWLYDQTSGCDFRDYRTGDALHNQRKRALEDERLGHIAGNVRVATERLTVHMVVLQEILCASFLPTSCSSNVHARSRFDMLCLQLLFSFSNCSASFFSRCSLLLS